MEPRKTEIGTLTVVIEASQLPGLTCPAADGGVHEGMHIALCVKKARPGDAALTVPGKPWLVIEPVPGDAGEARWEATVTVKRGQDGTLDFSGPHVRGAAGDRNLFLAWGTLLGDGSLHLIRGSKLALDRVEPPLIAEALTTGRPLKADAKLTSSGTLRGQSLAWSLGGGG